MWELEGVSLCAGGMSVSCPGFAQEESDDQEVGVLGVRRPGRRSLSVVLAPSTEGWAGPRDGPWG